jgi:hypothetical protein
VRRKEIKDERTATNVDQEKQQKKSAVQETEAQNTSSEWAKRSDLTGKLIGVSEDIFSLWVTLEQLHDGLCAHACRVEDTRDLANLAAEGRTAYSLLGSIVETAIELKELATGPMEWIREEILDI